MFLVTNLFSVLIPLWGMVGLWTQRIGYHNRVSVPIFHRLSFQAHNRLQWEFYFYNVVFGLFQAPYYAVRSITTPPPVQNEANSVPLGKRTCSTRKQ
jgi:ABC-type antimicrobial peptide transport system ATPase subunit